MHQCTRNWTFSTWMSCLLYHNNILSQSKSHRTWFVFVPFPLRTLTRIFRVSSRTRDYQCRSSASCTTSRIGASRQASQPQLALLKLSFLARNSRKTQFASSWSNRKGLRSESFFENTADLRLCEPRRTWCLGSSWICPDRDLLTGLETSY